MTSKPWLSGPRELLAHAVEHLQLGGAFDYRIAMISVDNAVELGIRTYLGLPERIRGTKGPKRSLLEAQNSFPQLLDLLEKFADEQIGEIALGDIEVYHRLRNTLYHDGNGVTVDPAHVEAYLEIAKSLMSRLLGLEPDERPSRRAETGLGGFVEKWAALEARLRFAARNLEDVSESLPLRKAVRIAVAHDLVPADFESRLAALIPARNAIVHGVSAPPDFELGEVQHKLDELLDEVPAAGC